MSWFTQRNKVLGMNARSAIYLRGNKRKARTIADDKLQTKKVLLNNGIAAAELLAVINDSSEAQQFDWEMLPGSFVIKPNRGMGGEGILVIFSRLKNGNWLTTNKRELSAEDLTAHIHNILDGNYSLLNTPDTALIESRLTMDPLYKRFATHGIPDIRVIVYNGVPVLAMLRMPVKKSGGKANLAQGGIGIGIDITTGFTTHAMQKAWFYSKEVDRHPDTDVKLRGVRLPYWDQILKTAVLSTRVVGLNYSGVDISIDKKRGPVVLELNARPGLGIQAATMVPLRDRLRRIRGLKVSTPERGIAIAKELFSGQFAQQVESITGRQVIGLIEPITIYGKDELFKKTRAKIDTGADGSSIDIGLAKELGFEEAIAAFDKLMSEHDTEHFTQETARAFKKEHEDALRKENKDIAGVVVISSSHGVSIRVQVRVQMVLGGHRMTVITNVFDRSHLTYKVLVGRRNLSHYLIDSTKQLFTKSNAKPKKATAAEKKATNEEDSSQKEE